MESPKRAPLSLHGSRLRGLPGNGLSVCLPSRSGEAKQAGYGIRTWKTLGSRDAGGGSVLIFDSSQFFTQARSFGAILCRFDMELDGGDAADRIENLGDGIVLAFAGMFQLVGNIVLVLCVAFQSGNAALKVLDVHPALSPRDCSIGDSEVGSFPRAAVLQHTFELVEIVDAAPIPLIGGHAVPDHGLSATGLHAFPELIHPTQLVFRIAIPVRRSFDEPHHGLGIIGLHAEAMLKHIADIFLGVVAAMLRGFVEPAKSLAVILWLVPSLLGDVVSLAFVVGGASATRTELARL